MEPIPPHLIKEILKGNCVAFVGAGFAVPAGLPRWPDLLVNLLSAAEKEGVLKPPKHGDKFMAEMRRLIGSNTAEAFDRVAQTLSDELTEPVFESLIAKQLELQPPLTPQMQRRLELLQQIPFRAIITTNYDSLIEGPTPFDPERPFRDILRPSGQHELDRLISIQSEVFDSISSRSDGSSLPTLNKKKALGIPTFRVPVIQIHGSVKESNSIVCTRSGYRKLLYHAPGYQTFIHSLMSTSTILYMGFSFTDSYLNEARSAVLSMLDWAGPSSSPAISSITPRGATPSPRKPGKTAAREPIAYAIINDQTELDWEFLRHHEGVHLLTWNTKPDPSLPHSDWLGLDRYLETIYMQSNVHHRMGKLLYGKRILFNDPMGENVRIAAYCQEVVHRYEECVRKTSPETADADDSIWGSNAFLLSIQKKAALMKAKMEKVLGASPLPDASISPPPAATTAGTAPPNVQFVLTYTLSSTLDTLRSDRSPFDLIVTNYGYAKPPNSPDVINLLTAMRRDVEPARWAPVLVFSTASEAEMRRKMVMRAGAADYCYTLLGLLKKFEEILGYDPM